MQISLSNLCSQVFPNKTAGRSLFPYLKAKGLRKTLKIGDNQKQEGFFPGVESVVVYSHSQPTNQRSDSHLMSEESPAEWRIIPLFHTSISDKMSYILN